MKALSIDAMEPAFELGLWPRPTAFRFSLFFALHADTPPSSYGSCLKILRFQDASSLRLLLDAE
jgi:hypothetical protein